MADCTPELLRDDVFRHCASSRTNAFQGRRGSKGSVRSERGADHYRDTENGAEVLCLAKEFHRYESARPLPKDCIDLFRLDQDYVRIVVF